MDRHSSHKLVIPLKLHSLNEYIGACRRNPYRGAKMKKEDQQSIEWLIRSQLRGIRIDKPVRMSYRWYEPNQIRDLDNISSYGRKVIQDALVKTKVLENDGWRHIVGFSDEFHVDKKSPRIEVEITEVYNGR